MFTLGIFTTHLPYLLMVVFYAFFWMVGVNKATAGELTSDDNSLMTGITVTEQLNIDSPEHSFSFQDEPDPAVLLPEKNHQNVALQRIVHNGYYLINYYPGKVYSFLFCRPPPLLL